MSSFTLQEKLPWAEEVLVSKGELEERRSHVLELEQQVAELTMQTEYQLRLKDLHVQVIGATAVHLCVLHLMVRIAASAVDDTEARLSTAQSTGNCTCLHSNCPRKPLTLTLTVYSYSSYTSGSILPVHWSKGWKEEAGQHGLQLANLEGLSFHFVWC